MGDKEQFSNKSVFLKLCDICDEMADITYPIMRLAMDTRFDKEEKPYEWRREVIPVCYNYEQEIATELIRLARFCHDRSELSLRIEDFQDISSSTFNMARKLHELRKYVISSKDDLSSISETSNGDFTPVIEVLESAYEQYDKPYEELLKLSVDLSEYAYPDV